MPTNAFNFGPVLDQALANSKSILAALLHLETKMAEDFTKLMQATDDLKAEVAMVISHIDDQFQDLKNALGTGNQAAVDDATAAVQAQIDALKAAVTAT